MRTIRLRIENYAIAHALMSMFSAARAAALTQEPLSGRCDTSAVPAVLPHMRPGAPASRKFTARDKNAGTTVDGV